MNFERLQGFLEAITLFDSKEWFCCPGVNVGVNNKYRYIALNYFSIRCLFNSKYKSNTLPACPGVSPGH